MIAEVSVLLVGKGGLRGLFVVFLRGVGKEFVLLKSLLSGVIRTSTIVGDDGVYALGIWCC
jgi:hypothetical protein